MRNKLAKSFLSIAIIAVVSLLPGHDRVVDGQSGGDSADVVANVIIPGNKPDTKPGEVLEWQKSLNTTSNAVRLDGTVVETIQEGHNFAGNLELPSGWSAEYSTDPLGTKGKDRTYQDYDTTPGAYTQSQLAQMRYIRIDTGRTQSIKPSAETPLLQPLDEQRMDFAEEGYVANSPILFDDKIFLVFKGVRADAESKNIDCFDLVEYERCEGYPSYVSTTDNPSDSSRTDLGTGTPDITTPLEFQIILDKETSGKEGRMYFPGQRGAEYGVVCVDLNTQENCGFTVMGSSNLIPNGRNPAIISGFVEENGKLYGHANDVDKVNQTVVCFDLTSQAVCENYDSDTTGPGPLYRIQEHYNSYNTYGNHLIYDGKLYWSVDYRVSNSNIYNPFPPSTTQRTLGTKLYCFDVNTRSNCAGFTTITRFTATIGVEKTKNMFFLEAPGGGAPTAICTIVGFVSSVDPAESCYDKDTGASVPDRTNMLPNQWLFTPWTANSNTTTITGPDGHKRTYFPLYKTGGLGLSADNGVYRDPTKGATICYDWEIQDTCFGFGGKKLSKDDQGDEDPSNDVTTVFYTGLRYWHEINGGGGGDLGYVYDGSCMWGIGFHGDIWSFDPITAETPCRVAKSENTVSLNEDDYYCDGKSRALNWGKVRLAKAEMFDFKEFDLTISSSDQTLVLFDGDLKQVQDNVLDASSPAFQSVEELSIDIEAELFNTSPWASRNVPYLGVVAESSSDNVQYCYETEVPVENCDVATITSRSGATIKTGVDTLTKTKNKNIDVVQAPDKQCFQDLRVGLDSDKDTVRPGDEINYTISVLNKANVDPERRGDINGARIVFTIPTNFTYVSSTGGGNLNNNKVVWSNKAINAASTFNPTVTLRAEQPEVSYEVQKPGLFMGAAYAAEVQESVFARAEAVFAGDVDSSDNAADDSGVTLVSEENDDSGGGDDDGGTDDGNGDDSGDDGAGVGETPADDTSLDGSLERSGEAPSDGLFYTPDAIENIVPEAIKDEVEFVFEAIYNIVTPIPDGVAIVLPYAVIGFLMVISVMYIFLIGKERKNKRDIRTTRKRFEQAEKDRQEYINIISHYLGTPIATMKLSLEGVKKTKKNEKLLESVNSLIDQISSHVDELLSFKSKLSAEVESKPSSIAVEKYPLKGFEFIAPVVGVLIISAILNILFIWNGKYDVSFLLLSTQVILFVVAVFVMGIAYRSFRVGRIANDIAQKEFQLEQDRAIERSSFIVEAGNLLSKDTDKLDKKTKQVLDLPKTEAYESGINSIKNVVSKLVIMNNLILKKRISWFTNSDVSSIAEEVAQEYRPEAEKKIIDFSMFIEPNILSKMDAEDLKFVFRSILDNAIKFNNEGGNMNLIVSTNNKNNLLIVLKDTGVGMNKTQLKKVFTPFARGTGTLEYDYEGLGIDLSIVKLIIEYAGGTVKMDSEQKVGSTITISVPLS